MHRKILKPGSIFIDGLSWREAPVRDTVAPRDSSNMIALSSQIHRREGTSHKEEITASVELLSFLVMSRKEALNQEIHCFFQVSPQIVNLGQAGMRETGKDNSQSFFGTLHTRFLQNVFHFQDVVWYHMVLQIHL